MQESQPSISFSIGGALCIGVSFGGTKERGGKGGIGLRRSSGIGGANWRGS